MPPNTSSGAKVAPPPPDILRRLRPPATVAEICSPSSTNNCRREALRGVPPAKSADCPEGLIPAIEAAASRGDWPIYLTGATGVGKTCGAAVLFRNWLEFALEADAEPLPKWMPYATFCGRLAEIRRNGSTVIYHPKGGASELTEGSWWRYWSNPALVVIDEIGTRSDSDFRVEAMLQLLECRTNQATILTGNLDDAGIIQAFDERVLSRIRMGTVIKLEGLDRRLSGARNRTITIPAR